MGWMTHEWDGRVEEGSSELFQNYSDPLPMERQDMTSRTAEVYGKSLDDYDVQKRIVEKCLSNIEKQAKLVSEGPTKRAMRATWRKYKAALDFLVAAKDEWDIDDLGELVARLDGENTENWRYSEYQVDIESIPEDLPFRLFRARYVSKLASDESNGLALTLIKAINGGGFKSKYWLYRRIQQLGLNKTECIQIWKLWKQVHGSKTK
jgi:hypothetical protein